MFFHSKSIFIKLKNFHTRRFYLYCCITSKSSLKKPKTAELKLTHYSNGGHLYSFYTFKIESDDHDLHPRWNNDATAKFVKAIIYIYISTNGDIG
jgi:hypothetical protein